MYIHALPLGVSYPSRPKILLWSHSSHAGGEDPPPQPPAWLGMIFYFRFLVSSSSNLNLYIQLIMLKLCHFRNKHMLNRKSYLTLGTSLWKNFSFFLKSKMAAGGQKLNFDIISAQKSHFGLANGSLSSDLDKIWQADTIDTQR